MAKNAIITTLSILAIVASAVFIVRTQWPRRPKVNVKPYQALGKVVAEETAKILGGKGRIVLLIPDTGDFRIPRMEAQLGYFKETLEQKGGITLAATEKFKMPPMNIIRLNTAEFVEPSIGLPPEDFAPVLNRYSKLDALVSFIGLPPVASQELKTLKERFGKLIIVSSYDPRLKELLKTGLIERLIVPRWEQAAQPAKKPKTLPEWFDQSYMLLTPENAARLAF